MPIDHVIWDWNGTIFCDSRALIDATVDAFALAALPAVTVQRYQELHVQPIPAFYDRLAGRTLTDPEQRLLADLFQQAYLRRRAGCGLNDEAATALTRCDEAGLTQSLLSMYPHDQLVGLVRQAGIEGHFTRVDGLRTDERHYKVPHLRRHLRSLGRGAAGVGLVGDSVDDARAAREVGAHCVLYNGGLHARAALEDEGVPVADSLLEALDLLRTATDPVAVRPVSRP